MQIKDKLRLLRRWWRSPLSRNYELQFSPIYWLLKKALWFSKFQVRKVGFKAKSSFRSSIETGSLLGQVVREILLRVIIAVLVVVVLVLIEYWGRSKNLFFLRHEMDENAQLIFLSSLGAVAAAFVGLYFTAISIIASSATYARAPDEIRTLIMKELADNFYFKVLAQFAGIVAIMLTALALKWPIIGPLNTCVVTLLCLFSIFSFFVLLRGVFRFSDPNTLTLPLNRDLVKWIQLATPAGYQWRDASFQSHYQRNAERALNNFSYLVVMASHKDNLYGKTLSDLGQRLLELLGYYSYQKAKIPSNSFWFKRRFKHKDWLLTQYHEIEIALKTGTSLQPESVSDLMWFETQIIQLLQDILRQLSERKDLNGTVSFATSLQKTMGTMGMQLAVEEALQVFKALAPHLRQQSGGEQITSAEGEQLQKATNCLAIVELYSLGLINLLLGLSRKLEMLPPSVFGNKIKAIDWHRERTLYAEPSFPREAIQELEDLQVRVEFESRVEGKLVTPIWLLTEFVGRRLVQFLDGVAEAIVAEFENTFGTEADKQLAAKNYILVAQLVQRGMEACNKVSNNFGEIHTLYEQYLKLNRSKEYEWPKTNWDNFQKRIAALRERLVIALAKSSLHLAQMPESKTWPDFFGQAYSVLADECFVAMASGREDLFKELFPAFFYAALNAHDKIIEKFRLDKSRIRLRLEPLSDLVELSGYAEVFSELDGKNFWSLVKESWDNHFAAINDATKGRELIKYFCQITEPTPYITSRSVLRTGWRQRFERVLIAKKIKPDLMQRYGTNVVHHASPLVRTFACGDFSIYEAQVVFLANYLFKRQEAQGVKKPHEVEGFEHHLKRESEKKDSTSESDEE